MAQVPPCAIWLRSDEKKVYTALFHAYTNDISGSDSKKKLTTVASIEQGLYPRSMCHLENHHTGSLMYRHCCKQLNQGKKRFNAWLSILNNGKTIPRCGNASSSRLEVAFQTRPHAEKQCIISWLLMLSPPCEPSAMNHMHCLLIGLKRRHQNCYCIVPNVFGIIETTEILIVIDAVCEVSKSFKTPSNLIL